MSYQLRFRKLLGAQVSKPDTGSEKSYLNLLWERGSSAESSPEFKRKPDKKRETILTLLSSTVAPTPPKKLYCPPRIEEVRQEKPKEQPLEFAYSMISVSSTGDIDIPEEILDSKVFTFKGGEKQMAWNSFKQSVMRARFALVALINVLFFFENGKVKGKALTGTANIRLSELSNNLPNVDPDKVIGFVEQWIDKEKLALYSTEMFDYSTVTPVGVKKCEMQSASGILRRITLSGCLFAPLLVEIRKHNVGASTMPSALKI